MKQRKPHREWESGAARRTGLRLCGLLSSRLPWIEITTRRLALRFLSSPGFRGNLAEREVSIGNCRRLFLIIFVCAEIICTINIGWFDSSRLTRFSSTAELAPIQADGHGWPIV
jgi:hypothetical protein